MSAATPDWFCRALDAPVEIRSVAVDGAQIAYRAWGPPAADGVVLVHGGSAHSRWWDHVAPLLDKGRRVLALDLSGHGDSSRRPEYALPSWAREVMAVVADADVADAPVIVGHSMGGFVALQTALDHGSELAGVIVVDSPVHNVGPEEHVAIKSRAIDPPRRYPSPDAALSRFRLLPDQEAKLDFVLDHIAQTSVVEHDGYWMWKFDPLVFRDPFLELAALAPLACRLALLRAENGRLSAEMSADVNGKTGGTALEVEITAAGHHVMIDQPLALVSTIQTVLASWSRPAG